MAMSMAMVMAVVAVGAVPIGPVVAHPHLPAEEDSHHSSCFL